MKGNEQFGQQDPYVAGKKSGTVKEMFAPKIEKTYKAVGICARPSFEEYAAPVKCSVFMAVAPYQLKEAYENSGLHTQIGLTVLSKNPPQSVGRYDLIENSDISSNNTPIKNDNWTKEGIRQTIVP